MPAPLNLILIPVGSAGDVHPIVGIGIALKERGHRVTVCTNGYFRELVERNELSYEEWGTKEQYLQAISDPEIWHPTRGPKKVFSGIVRDFLRPSFDALRARMQREKFIMVGSPLCLSARLLNEKFGVPLISTHLQPLIFRTVYEQTGIPMTGPHSPAWWIHFLYWMADHAMIDPAICPALNQLRKEQGLPPISRVLKDWWHSPDCILALWPDWFGSPQPDWPKNIHIAGFPLYDERTIAALPPELDRFLSDGSPPIAFTPGSAMRQGRQFFEAAADACRRLKRRGLLLTRFGENIPPALPPGVIHVEFAPFSQLLPRCAALVHHGGIGTMAQGFAAGLPQLVMPLSHDQPDNALRLKRLGAGDSLYPKYFKGPAVAAKLASLLDQPTVQRHCAELKQKIAEARPLNAVCDVIEQFATKAGYRV